MAIRKKCPQTINAEWVSENVYLPMLLLGCKLVTATNQNIMSPQQMFGELINVALWKIETFSVTGIVIHAVVRCRSHLSVKSISLSR